MNEYEWLAKYGAIGNCEHWHRTGGHDRALCPLDEATCDYIRQTTFLDGVLSADYLGQCEAKHRDGTHDDSKCMLPPGVRAYVKSVAERVPEEIGGLDCE